MRVDRLNAIEQYIVKHGTVSMEELVSHFQVSMNTIRRDINELLAREHIKKVYGGVAINESPVLPYAIRAVSNSSAKERIGRLAAGLVRDGDTIFLDAGSTTPYLLPFLSERRDVTVITHSLIAMIRASECQHLNLIGLGGVFSNRTSAFASIATVEELTKFHIRTSFLAATGVSLEAGLTNASYLDAEIKRRVAQQAEQVVLMADGSKFDHSAVHSFFPFEKLTAVVTDERPPENYVRRASEVGIQLLWGDRG